MVQTRKQLIINNKIVFFDDTNHLLAVEFLLSYKTRTFIGTTIIDPNFQSKFIDLWSYLTNTIQPKPITISTPAPYISADIYSDWYYFDDAKYTMNRMGYIPRGASVVFTKTDYYIEYSKKAFVL